MDKTIDQGLFRRIVLRSVTIPLALSLLLSGCFIYLILHLMSLTELVDHSNRIVSSAQEILQSAVDAETGMRGYKISADKVFLEPYTRVINDMDPKFAAIIDLTRDNPDQSRRMAFARESFQEWKRFAERAIEAVNSGSNKREVEDIAGALEGKRLMDDYRTRVARFIKEEEALRDARSEKTVDTVRMALMGILGLSLITGIFLAFNTRKQLTTLTNSFNDLLMKASEQSAELTRQEWVRSSQAELSRVMLGDDDLSEFSRKVLDYFIDRTGAAIGAFYFVKGNEVQLEAHQALDNPAPSLKIGQGLVGEAARSNKIREVSHEKTDMEIRWTSGSVSPSDVMVIPFALKGEVRGVMELGWKLKADDKVREFLTSIQENVATGLLSVEYRMQLKDLLEEAQRQAEELQAQQEELRATNEELEEQSNALKTSQVRLETQASELEETNQQLNFQARELEKQTDILAAKNAEILDAQREVEMKARELEISGQYKSQFLANMSHELRTPLNSTLILSQLLVENKKGRLGQEEIEYSKTIMASCQNLMHLINDILDLSKVEAGKIDLTEESVDLRDLAGELEGLFAHVAEGKKIGLTFNVDKSLTTITSDQHRIMQILKNLVSNAIKFTEKGSVDIAMKDNKDSIEIAVKDTGIGISGDQIDTIFEAFKQADGSTSRKYGGTGLGLTISRDLARLLGGTISVDSEPGKGSTFRLRLPKTPGKVIPTVSSSPVKLTEKPAVTIPQPAAIPDDRNKLSGDFRLLLVVEDDSSFAKVIYDLSHELGFKCIIAQKADEGIDCALHYRPNAVILDMNLPDHSGFVVLDRLKMDPRTRHIPVHIISAQDKSIDAMKMGAIGFLQKPADLDALKNAINLLGEKSGSNKRKVLVVEDDAAQRSSIQALINDLSVEVHTVMNGAEAIKSLTTETYDCMILDLSLPDMTGFDLLEKIADGSKVSPPVIIYTGKDLTKNEEEKLQRYSNSIIIKGAHSPERLLSEVSLFLHQVESDLPAERRRMLQELRDREKVFENKKILLVDDDVRNIFAMSSALEGKGAIVETARNGLEAVKKVSDDETIDLVLMDIMMPEMDGFEAMRRIRKDLRFKDLPMIAVTAKAMPDDQARCREAGANDYLAKPVDLQKLLSLLRVWMPQRKRV